MFTMLELIVSPDCTNYKLKIFAHPKKSSPHVSCQWPLVCNRWRTRRYTEKRVH